MTYDDIVMLAQAYSDRSDTDFPTLMPFFMKMAELNLNRLLEGNRSEVVGTIPWDSDTTVVYDLPSDYGHMRHIWLTEITTDERVKDYGVVTPVQYSNLRTRGFSNGFYYISDNKIYIDAPFTTEYRLTLVYNRQLPPLTPTNQTNWLSITHGDIYVQALVVEMCKKAKDWESVTGHKTLLNEYIDQMNIKEKRASVSGTSLQTRIE
jgi:hypothetical protein